MGSVEVVGSSLEVLKSDEQSAWIPYRTQRGGVGPDRWLAYAPFPRTSAGLIIQTMEDQLDRLERQIERLIEEPLSRILGPEALASAISGRLTRALAETLYVESSGRVYAPDRYRITLHADSICAFQQEAPELMANLEEGLVQVVRSGGYLLAQEPRIELDSDPKLGRGEVRVRAWHSRGPLEVTQVLRPPSEKEAVLAIGSDRLVRLQPDGISIGRRHDNDIVLDDPRVSRLHARIHFGPGKYVLVDMDSKAGTFVNGQAVERHELRNGEVISIAGIQLEYREGSPGDQSTPSDETTPMKRSSGSGMGNPALGTSGDASI